MERRLRFGFSVFQLLGVIFLCFGLVFTGVGLALGVFASDPDGPVLCLVFCCIGLPFLGLGLGFLIFEIRKRRQIRRLISDGRYIWGAIFRIDEDTKITINHRHPQVAVVQCSVGGRSLFFTSGHLPRYFPDSLIGQQVKVYCQAPEYRPYYVDMAPLLQNSIIL